MGVFSSPGEDDDDAEDRFRESNSTSGYLAYHARKQLSFDMWWLVTAVRESIDLILLSHDRANYSTCSIGVVNLYNRTRRYSI